MKASILDLRYKMKDVLKALEKNETVTILYHGQEKGIISPTIVKQPTSISEHPFFGMHVSKNSVLKELDHIRKPRYS